MGKIQSDAGKYNNSTHEFIKSQYNRERHKKFAIMEKIKDFLYEQSEEFFNDTLERIRDIKIIDDKKLLNYTRKPYELKNVMLMSWEMQILFNQIINLVIEFMKQNIKKKIEDKLKLL